MGKQQSRFTGWTLDLWLLRRTAGKKVRMNWA